MLSALSITFTHAWAVVEAAKCTTQNDTACLISYAAATRTLMLIRSTITARLGALAICSIWRTECGPASAPMGECVSEASLTPRHHALAQGRYATMAGRGKAGAVLIGARVTGAASPGFDMQTGRLSRGHALDSLTASRLGACESLWSSDVNARVDAEQPIREWNRSGEAS